METTSPRPQGQDQPLPHGLANRVAGWASVARQYPIFGKTWFGYRMRSFLLPLVLLALVLVFVGALASPPVSRLHFNLTLGAVWLVVALALFLGLSLIHI